MKFFFKLKDIRQHFYIFWKLTKDQYVHFLPEGGKHDAGMLADSGLLQDFQRHAFSPTGNPRGLTW